MSETYPHLHVLIVCDKSADDLWPLTRTSSPIELSTMAGDHQSLLAREVACCTQLSSEPVHIACDASMADIVRNHLIEQGVAGKHTKPKPGKSGKTARQLEMELLERSLFDPGEIDVMPMPIDRGSAFSIALAASQIKLIDPNAILLVLRSDIRFEPDELWEAAIGRAYRAAVDDYVAVIGIKPTSPTSLHGYIRRGGQLPGIVGVYNAVNFVTNPTPSLAVRMQQLATYWDSGILMARATVALSELHNASATEGTLDSTGSTRIAETAGFLAALGRDHWNRSDARAVVAALPQASYAQAVLEVSKRVAVVDSSLSWQCISSFSSLDEFSPRDENRNHLIGNVICTSSSGSTIYAQGRLLAVHGLRNVLVVDTPDATLIAAKEQLGSIDELRDAASGIHAPELDTSPVSWQSWGCSTLLGSNEGYEVHRLEINPKSETPAEASKLCRKSFTAVSGKGMLRIGEKSHVLVVGTSTFVDAGAFFSIEATGIDPLVLIEVITTLPDSSAR